MRCSAQKNCYPAPPIILPQPHSSERLVHAPLSSMYSAPPNTFTILDQFFCSDTLIKRWGPTFIAHSLVFWSVYCHIMWCVHARACRLAVLPYIFETTLIIEYCACSLHYFYALRSTLLVNIMHYQTLSAALRRFMQCNILWRPWSGFDHIVHACTCNVSF